MSVKVFEGEECILGIDHIKNHEKHNSKQTDKTTDSNPIILVSWRAGLIGYSPGTIKRLLHTMLLLSILWEYGFKVRVLNEHWVSMVIPIVLTAT
jgi:hypothetical protein